MAVPIPVNPQTAAQSDPGLFDKWRGWLGEPQNRAALLQTGLSLMQPMQGSQFSHIAGAVGQGLGAAGRTESRIQAEGLARDKINRELDAAALDQEIKRTGLELDKANSQSLIGQRNASVGIDRAKLGLDEKKLGNDTRYTDAQIANLQSQSDTRAGGLELKQQVEANRQAGLREKQSLEQQKLQLQQEKLRISAAGDAKQAQLIDARIKQIDTGIGQADKKVQSSTDALAKINTQAMFKARDNITKDVWTAANDPYAMEPRSQDELLAKRIELQRKADEAMGVGGSGQSGGVTPPGVSPPAPSAEAPRIKRNPKTGQQVILRNGQWVPYP